jgi:hypothetical protein
VQHSLVATGLVAGIAAFIAAEVRPWWLRCSLFVVATISLIDDNWGSRTDLAQQFLAQLILLAVVVYGVRRIVRFNLLGYFLILMVLALVGGASELLKQPNTLFQRSGWGVVCALVLVLLWPLLSWLRSPAEAATG